MLQKMLNVECSCPRMRVMLNEGFVYLSTIVNYNSPYIQIPTFNIQHSTFKINLEVQYSTLFFLSCCGLS